LSPAETATLRIERTFDAPVHEVFDAWTSPEVLRRWSTVGPAWRSSAEVDLRVGGSYRLAMTDPATGDAHVVVGEYGEVVRTDLLVYSWSWEGVPAPERLLTTVRVEFRSVGDGERTAVLIEHTGFPSDEVAQRHEVGWLACLDQVRARVLPGGEA
jgi:uncharacterized protein YndB with AHSA1/START domain